MNNQVVPDEEFVREQYSREQPAHIGTVSSKQAEFDLFMEHARRDAGREALIEFRRTELALIPSDADEDDPIRIEKYALAWRIELLIRSDYPEETP